MERGGWSTIRIVPEWNVKLEIAKLESDFHFHQNRTRVECKGNYTDRISTIVHIRIVPEWNVKKCSCP